MGTVEGISIEDFRGDKQGLQEMAHKAWRDEYGLDSYPDLYRPDYLDYLMQNVHDPRLAIAAYKGDEIAGFLLNLPRTMVLSGKTYRAALSCLLVVRKEFFRKGLALAMIQEGLERNRELKFDFTLFYLETGHRSSRLFAKLRDAGKPIERVKRMHVIGRILDLAAILESENLASYETAAIKLFRLHRLPRAAKIPEAREAGPEDADRILELLNSFQRRVRLARVFEKNELVNELFHPPIARTLVYEKDGDIKGVMAYVMIEHVGRKRVPWAWLNHVYWEELSLRERKKFVRAFLEEVYARGAAGVVEWSKHVYGASALYLNRFIPYPRQVDMMAWKFRDDISLSGIKDVYEVQI